MVLDTQTKSLLEQVNAPGNLQLFELGVEQARKGLKEMTLAMDAPESSILRWTKETIPGPQGDIPLRIYWPMEAEDRQTLPILLLYHGGGFALGDMETHHNMATCYCANAVLIVISVDYRLSPEHRFPAGVEDSYTALCWARDNASSLGGDARRIGVTGDSAGGNLSAVMCQLAKLRQGPTIAFQALVYPVVDMSTRADYPSRKEFGAGGYFLSLQDMNWLTAMYLEDVERQGTDLRCSPIHSSDLAGLPPALVITAGFDPLRDEGRHYAECLQAAGVEIEYVCFDSTIHGFLSFSAALDAGRDGLNLVASKLKEALHA